MLITSGQNKKQQQGFHADQLRYGHGAAAAGTTATVLHHQVINISLYAGIAVQPCTTVVFWSKQNMMTI